MRDDWDYNYVKMICNFKKNGIFLDLKTTLQLMK